MRARKERGYIPPQAESVKKKSKKEKEFVLRPEMPPPAAVQQNTYTLDEEVYYQPRPVEPVKADPVIVEQLREKETPVVFSSRAGVSATDDRNILYIHKDHIELRTISFNDSFRKKVQFLKYGQISRVITEDNPMNADLRIETEVGIPIYYHSMPKGDAEEAKKLIENKIKTRN